MNHLTSLEIVDCFDDQRWPVIVAILKCHGGELCLVNGLACRASSRRQVVPLFSHASLSLW